MWAISTVSLSGVKIQANVSSVPYILILIWSPTPIYQHRPPHINPFYHFKWLTSYFIVELCTRVGPVLRSLLTSLSQSHRPICHSRTGHREHRADGPSRVFTVPARLFTSRLFLAVIQGEHQCALCPAWADWPIAISNPLDCLKKWSCI